MLLVFCCLTPAPLVLLVVTLDAFRLCTAYSLSSLSLSSVEHEPRKRKEDQKIRDLIEAADYQTKIQQFIEHRTARAWSIADKSHELKNTGWSRSKAEKPSFSSTSWQPNTVSQINQVLFGHLPTRDCLKRRGLGLEDDQCRLCGLYQETRDHFLTCKALRHQRQQIFLHAKSKSKTRAPISMRPISATVVLSTVKRSRGLVLAVDAWQRRSLCCVTTTITNDYI